MAQFLLDLDDRSKNVISPQTPSTMTLSIMTLSMTAPSIMTLSITIKEVGGLNFMQLPCVSIYDFNNYT
jgi:hypothetical protein